MGYKYRNTKSKNGRKLGRPRKTAERVARETIRKAARRKPTRKPHKRKVDLKPFATRLSRDDTIRITEMWLDHVSVSEIARRLGVHKTAVIAQLRDIIIPSWRQQMISSATATQARLRHIGSTAYQRWVDDPRDATAAQLLKWSHDTEIRLLGLEAPVKVDINEYRVAGKSREAVTTQMMDRLVAHIERMRTPETAEE